MCGDVVMKHGVVWEKRSTTTQGESRLAAYLNAILLSSSSEDVEDESGIRQLVACPRVGWGTLRV